MAMKRVRKGVKTRRIATEREQGDYVLRRIAGRGCPKKIKYAGIFVLRTSKERSAFFRQRHTTLISFAGMAELADAQDLGSCVNSCRFDPCYPHQRQVAAPNHWVATAKIRTLSHDGGVRI